MNDPKSLYNEEAFTRLDEGDDAYFYAENRIVSHLDATALETVERLVGALVVEDEPVVLDLMASWDSHIPESVRPARVVGLGMNENELVRNRALTDVLIHDINKDPLLPFPDGLFDVVLNTVSVDYMTRPFEIFRETGRVLKPGGLFLVIFSNRMFPEKAVKIWRESGEMERVMLVEDFFKASGLFEEPALFVSQGKPRPKDDRYADLGIPSDPVYVLYADRKGGGQGRRPRPGDLLKKASTEEREEIERKKSLVKTTLCCPYCDERLKKWAVPESPFVEWQTDFMYICFNDECPYLCRGWDTMNVQGNFGMSYRLMYNPERDRCMPVPVMSLKALREGIVDEA